ncbi:MAG TPA: DEAD/DEAH box helicase [Desulfurivibrionaceae bacterium]|nr:DEAD/DEAH box helicase [Desulfurivibrionaceae bacterium]
MQFNELNLHPQLTANIAACGYQTPSPIQEQAIPVALAGRDLLGLAQTGTGKTAAFLLPLLHHLLAGQHNKKPRALIIAPTRELAEQIHADIGKLGKNTGLRSVSVYGGVGKLGQIKAFRSGVDIIVACPGRLLDHLQAKDVSLAGITHLVLDEADHMFDMGFLPTIRQILRQLPKERQTLLFSATMPQELQRLAEEVLHKPATVQVANNVPTATVAHVLFPVEQPDKASALKKIMQETEMTAALIFTRTKHKARHLATQLSKAGYSATSLQGNLSQSQRQTAMNGFREGRFKILVATDIAARGIDVSSVSHVINYDVPDSVEAYIHRTGRTGRAAKTGTALTLAGREDTPMISRIEKTLGKPMRREHVECGQLAVDSLPATAPAPQRQRARQPRMGSARR